MKVWTFTPGTVLDVNHSIYVVADERNFLDDIRNANKSNGQQEKYFFVQHGHEKLVEQMEKCLKKKRTVSPFAEKKAFYNIEPRKVNKELQMLSSSPLSIDSSNCTEPEAGPWEEWGECCRGSKCGVYCDEPSASRGRRRELNFTKFIDELLRKTANAADP